MNFVLSLANDKFVPGKKSSETDWTGNESVRDNYSKI